MEGEGRQMRNKKFMTYLYLYRVVIYHLDALLAHSRKEYLNERSDSEEARNEQASKSRITSIGKFFKKEGNSNIEPARGARHTTQDDRPPKHRIYHIHYTI